MKKCAKRHIIGKSVCTMKRPPSMAPDVKAKRLVMKEVEPREKQKAEQKAERKAEQKEKPRGEMRE